MTLKTFNKMSKLLISISTFGFLVACSPNPMKIAKPKDAAQFLVHASKVAQDKLNLNASTGYFYGQCMIGKVEKALCAKIYQGMVDYAKTTEAFSTLSISNLTNKSLFAKLEDDYEREVFNSVDSTPF